MRFLTVIPAVFGAAISAVLLPGCSGGNVQPSAIAQLSAAGQPSTYGTPNTSGAYVYTCAPAYTMSGKGNCRVYDTTGHLLAQLTANDDLSYPWGTALFGGNWYITNGGFEQIRVYTQGTSPQYVGSLSDPSAYPIDVAVYGNKGKVKLVAVANNGAPNSGSGGAVVYQGTSALPSYSLKMPAGHIVGIGIGFDSKGDCAFAFGYSKHQHNRPTNHILLYKKCAGDYTDLGIANLGFPAGVIFDQHDNLIVVDQRNGIRVCTGTSNCNVAVPKNDFFYMGLNSAGTDLWVTRYSTGEVYDYAYPSLTVKFKFRPANSKTEPTAGIAAN